MFRVLASSDKRFACNASASGDLLRRLFLGGFLSGYCWSCSSLFSLAVDQTKGRR